MRKALAFVSDLEVARLREAHVAGSGAWSCNVELPALPYRLTF